MEFLTQDLDDIRQPAVARLVDDVTTLTQAKFDTYGVVITHFGTDSKPKQYRLNWIELLALSKAAEAYQQAIADHETIKEARKDALIEQAYALAGSVHFDLESLNIQVTQHGEYWEVSVPAIGFQKNYCEGAHAFLENVQAALKHIHSDVHYAEENGWTGREWKQIIASYRRAFPLEPQEIVEAKKLLTEAGLTNWQIKAAEKYTDGSTHGYGFFHEDVLHFACPSGKEADLLASIKRYIEKKTEQGEPEEIVEARRLLKEHLHATDWVQCSIYPGAKPDTWSFDNGQDMENVLWLDKPAANLLELIKQYVSEPAEQEERTQALSLD